MCRNQRWIPVFLTLLAQLTLGCGPIPTDPDSETSSSEGTVYVNEEWGFQLTVPDDSTWSLNAQTLFQDRESNGLPKVNVQISKFPLQGTRFRPTLVVDPRALPRGNTIETFVASLEEELRARFIGYGAEEKRTLQIDAAEGVEWVFRTASFRGYGSRFLAAVVVHRQQVYVMLGSGIRVHFPLEEYRGIISSMKFLR
jgi:hypothetical protein